MSAIAGLQPVPGAVGRFPLYRHNVYRPTVERKESPWT